MALGFVIVFYGILELLKSAIIFIVGFIAIFSIVFKLLKESFKAYKVGEGAKSGKFLIFTIISLIVFDMWIEYIGIKYPYIKEITRLIIKTGAIYFSIAIVLSSFYDLFIYKKIRKDNNQLKRILLVMILIYIGTKIILRFFS